MLERGIIVHRTPYGVVPIIEAAKNGHLSVIKLIDEAVRDASNNTPNSVRLADRNRITPLNLAIKMDSKMEEEKIKTIKVILACGVDPNFQAVTLQYKKIPSAFEDAIEANAPEIVGLFLQHEARVTMEHVELVETRVKRLMSANDQKNKAKAKVERRRAFLEGPNDLIEHERSFVDEPYLGLKAWISLDKMNSIIEGSCCMTPIIPGEVIDLINYERWKIPRNR